jgi:hypothetical protein
MLTFRQFITEGDTKFTTGVPVTFDYFRHNQKTENYGSRFGQHIEPAGKYVVEMGSNKDFYKNLGDGYETGEITFENPLVIDFGGGYTEESNWKFVLYNKYDGIVTMEKGHTLEIVDLRMFK